MTNKERKEKLVWILNIGNYIKYSVRVS